MISINPATGRTLFTAPVSAPSEIESAVQEAVAAQQEWADRPMGERQSILRAFADRVDDQRSQLATRISQEVGKRMSEALGEVDWTALSARYYADNPPTVDMVDGARVVRRPLGVVAAITPWNVPLVTSAWKWLPALMAGNAVVWKPSEFSSSTALFARDLLYEAGLPAGVFRVVLGGADEARSIVSHPLVSGIHFTGSTAAGRSINAAAAPRLARVALELGGINTAVVFADADASRTLDDIVASATAINGQKCTAVRRILVADEVAESIIPALAQRISGLRVGPPDDETCDVGPLIHTRAAEYAESLVRGAVSRGARVIARACLPDETPAGSAYFAPILLGDVSHCDPLQHDELFAPVLSVETFGSADEAVARANSSPYGLSAAVYTSDAEVATTMTRGLRAGVLNINGRSDSVGLTQPFGGLGDSGNGFPEGGTYVYSALTDLQAIYGDLAPKGTAL